MSEAPRPRRYWVELSPGLATLVTEGEESSAGALDVESGLTQTRGVSDVHPPNTHELLSDLASSRKALLSSDTETL
jgi:hypothetical protein